MSTTHAIQTTVEIFLVIAVVIGMFYEPIIAKWERKQAEKVLRALKIKKRYRK